MKRSALLGLISAVILSAVACERASNDLAFKKPQVAAPTYDVEPAVSMIPAAAQMKSVAPHGKGPDGAALFAANCAVCHQTSGKGVPGAFPPLDGSPYVQSPNTDRIAAIMLYGLQGPISVMGTSYNGAMIAFGSKLTDEELAAIASYIRGTWSNKSEVVDPSVFAKARQKWGARGPCAIEELGVEK